MTRLVSLEFCVSDGLPWAGFVSLSSHFLEFIISAFSNRDEQIRVLSEQNRSLLDMLELEEKTSKERELAVKDPLT